MEHTFHLFSDDNILNKTVDYTNNRVNETIARLHIF